MDTRTLDDLMERASKIDLGERRKLKQAAKAVRDDCAEVRSRLAQAEAQIVALVPEVPRMNRCVKNFRWDLVRADGRMPEDVKNHLAGLNASTNGGLTLIRETIRKIDEFSEEDLAGKWRPSKDVGGIVANAGYAQEMLDALERALEYWAKRLADRLSPVTGGYEALEGERPAGSSGNVLTNIPQQ